MSTLLLIIALGIPTNGTTETWAGRHMANWLGYNDVSVSATVARNPAADYPSFQAFPTGSTTLAYAFSATADKCLDLTLQLPHDYKSGTALGCHIHWAPETTNNGTVGWLLDYTISNSPSTFAGTDGGIFGASQQLTESHAASGTAWKQEMSDFADISGSGLLQSAILVGRICRDGDASVVADTFTGLVFLLSIDCHIQVDSAGSTSELTK